ncbi:MAG TPA: hypothetical protein VH796_02815 [Nitrososphaeraceae archaeon]
MGGLTTMGMRIQVHAPVVIIAFPSLGTPFGKRDYNTSKWRPPKKDTLKSHSLWRNFSIPV